MKLFQAEITGDRAATLIAKGIVRPAHKQGQMLDFNCVPFEIPNYVWDVLSEMRDHFPYTPPRKGVYPWSTRSMQRF